MLNQCFARHGMYGCFLNRSLIKQLMKYFCWEFLNRWKPVVLLIVLWLRVKKGHKLRLCAEYKVQVNDNLLVIILEPTPYLTLKPFFQKCQALIFFAKICLSNAYWQNPLDEKSQVCTLNITQGLFRVTRLQQGLKNAAAIFQQAIKEVLKELDGCVAYQVDILLFCETEAELRKRYNVVKERLVAKNFTVNENK